MFVFEERTFTFEVGSGIPPVSLTLVQSDQSVFDGIVLGDLVPLVVSGRRVLVGRVAEDSCYLASLQGVDRLADIGLVEGTDSTSGRRNIHCFLP